MMSSPFRRGLCTGSSFQQTLRQRMREVSPSCPAGCLTPATSRALLPRLQELRALSQAGASESEAVVPAGLAQPKAVHEFRRKPRQGPQRRMVDHLLPPYVECNFRSLHFMMVRFPRVSDFPREKCAPRCPPPLPPQACPLQRAHSRPGCPPAALRLAPSCTRRYPPSPRSRRVYQPESLDLLYRHYYKNFRFG